MTDEFVQSLNDVALDDVRESLLSSGWEIKGERGGRVFLGRPRSENAVAEIVLPVQKDARYVAYLCDAARAVERFSRRDAFETLVDWKRGASDFIKFRLVSESARYGRASLRCVRALVDGATSALCCAVKDSETPSRFHKRVFSSSVDELVRRAEFGQTEKGSYVITARVPLDLESDSGKFVSTRPLVFRRAVVHLVKTLDSARRCAESESVDAFLNGSDASANLLDAFLQTCDSGGADLHLSVRWSTREKVAVDVPTDVYFHKERASFLREAAARLRPEKREESRAFVGVVVALESISGEGERPEGKAVFRVDDGAGSFLAETLLNPDDFKLACEVFYPNDELTFQARAVRQEDKAVLYNLVNLRRV